MKILNNAVIKDRYDVVVVGSGIGGLTAGAMLAKKGVNVLVIEQHYLPGGACTTMRRRGVTFDVGVGMMFGFGEKGLNPHRFVMNALEEELDIIPHESLYRMNIMGKELNFWRDFERFFEELTTIFPSQKDELRTFYDFLNNIYKIVISNEMVALPTELPLKENLKSFKNFLKHPRDILKLLPMMTQSTEDLLNRFFSDPKIISYFDMLCCTYCYCDSSEVPAALSAIMFVDNHEGGVFYPSGSPQMLSNKLEQSLERNGGQILLRQTVDEILIFKGKAYGVRLSDGTEIMADRVLSNATVWNLYGKLIRKRHIKPKRLEWAQSLVPTFPSLVLYLAIDAAAVPEGTTPIQMMIENMYDISGNDITVYVSSLDDPSLCPPGTHTMTAMAPVPDSIGKWPRPWEPAYHSEEYQRLKEQEAEKLLCQVEKHFTDLRKHIKFMEIGTPATIEHFTLKNWGAVGGPKQAIGQEMMKRLKAQSEWENLYNCGDSTVMGVGILATTVSGVTAANRILMDMGLEAYVPRSFDRQYINLVKGKPWTPPPDISEPITPESALRISRECQHCRAPECMKSCPAGIDVLNFLRRIETGNFPGAVRSMREMNPMAEICGHICPAEKLCQKNCNRLDFSDQATRIADLQAWVCSQVSNVEGWNRYHPPANGYRVAVIGAGPAGLSCAHFLARLGYRIDIMDKSNKMGGLPVHAIPVSRLPEEVAHREIEGMLLAGINFEHGKTLGKDFTLADLEKSYDAVFMAPGLWTGRKLNLPGLKSAHTIDALSFLKSCRSKKKVKVGKNVLVIGGGSVAADAAITAEYHGAARVSMICLEKIEEMPCLEDEIMTLNKKGIQLKNGWGPKEVLSNSKIAFIGCTAVFDKKGNFNPVYDDSKIMEVDFDQIIMAVGQSAEPALAKYLKKEFNTDGLIEIEEKTMQIKGRPGIYAGGDIVNGAGTVVQAVGDGRRAALAIDEKVNIKPGF